MLGRHRTCHGAPTSSRRATSRSSAARIAAAIIAAAIIAATIIAAAIIAAEASDLVVEQHRYQPGFHRAEVTPPECREQPRSDGVAVSVEHGSCS